MSTQLEQVNNPKLTPFERLVRLMAILRSPQGCNWDRQQTHESLLPYLIEETYEVVDSIESGRYDELPEELGDLLCQIVFHAQLGSETGAFTVDDVATGIVEKLIRRHPHVFGDKRDLKPQEVRDQWERLKSSSGEKETVLGGIPKSMPALTMAFRIGEKAGGVGFDWNQPREVLEKLREETAEVEHELSKDSPDNSRLTEEIGDLLFATASLARKLHIDPEQALKKALSKFKERFDLLEERVRRERGRFDAFTLDELEALWQDNKRK